MDGAANWRPTQGADPAAGGVDPNAAAPAGSDWRTRLQPEARHRIVNKIMETLKKHLPVSVPEGLTELHKIAVRFEEKIYTAATNQSDYLRKISLKMLSMESQTKTQQNPGNAQVIPNQNPPGPGYPGAPPTMPQPGAPPGSMPQPGAPPSSMLMQMAPLPRPPMLPPPTSGVPGAPIPNSAAPPAVYQANPSAPAGPTSGAPPAPLTAPQPAFSYAALRAPSLQASRESEQASLLDEEDKLSDFGSHWVRRRCLPTSHRPAAVEMELLCPSAKRRRSEDLAAGEPPPRVTEAAEAANLAPTTHGKEPPPPPPDAGGGGGDVDCISGLPDAVLGEIVSLLSTKEAGRTQILASRWRHVWLASPLVIDGRDLWTQPKDDRMFTTANEALASAVSLILSAHPGPGRRFCVPPHYLHDRPATVDAWLSSPALHNLQELDFWEGKHRVHRYDCPYPLAPPPASTFRFSATLRVATLSKCELPDSSVEGIHFPHLKQLGLENVSFSEGSLHTMISSCPVLECLLLKNIFGVGCLRISSNTLRSIGVGTDSACCRDNLQLLQEVIIVDAPCLERSLCLGSFKPTNLTIISAPKLETLGCLDDDCFERTRLVFGTIFIQGLKVVSLTTTLSSVKTLAVASYSINLDTVIELMKCFPCLENLYIKSYISGEMNRWRRKHRDFIKSSDIHLKKIVLMYRGIRSQINFASFFLLNARELELMRLEVGNTNYNEAFFAEQYGMLQMEKRASRVARLHFTNKACTHRIHVNHVRDLSVANPFECTE